MQGSFFCREPAGEHRKGSNPMNAVRRNTLGTAQPSDRLLSAGDVLILIALAVFLYFGLRLAIPYPTPVIGPDINLSASALPWYAMLSLTRMAAAYFLSL